MSKQYTTFKSFYPFYLGQHSNPVSRKLHYLGTSLVIVFLIAALILGQWQMLFLLPVLGYFFAWVGHFFFEKNRPATFTYPLYSLMADFRMFFEAITGRLDHAHFSNSE
ncbi:MAG: DUF962 domain-containing protein [Porticoccaceae bacterium]|nr:DUF962 domain-containing protein [Porticoccaceae bacterium]